MATYVIAEQNNRTEAFEINNLVSRLVDIDVEEGTETLIPLYPSVEKITRAGEALEVHVNITFPRRPFSVRSGLHNNRSAVIRKYLPDGRMELKEEKGLQFKFPISQGSSRINIDAIRFKGKRILPNIYDNKRLCFGSSNVPRRDGARYAMEDNLNAINTYLGATFNNDLSSISGGSQAAKDNVSAFLNTLENNPRNNEVKAEFQSLDREAYGNIYTFLALAVALDLSISDVQALLP